jgi:integrase
MHQEPLEPGKYLCYRRPKSGASGSWFARIRPKDAPKKTIQARMGTADDYMEADDRETLTYKQACKKAEDWFGEQSDAAHSLMTGEQTRKGPFTVADAMKDYLKDAERRGVKGHRIMTLTIEAHIIPALGGLEVSKLTKPKLDDWLHSLAEAPRRKTGRPRSEADEVEHLEAPSTEDERRARKDSANRIMTNLCAALNLALRNGRVKCKPAWKDVERFKNVGAARVHFLAVDEQRRLVNVCPSGFRELVQAALFSGCRYGELCRLTVRDFDPKAGTLFIEKSKSGKPRHITLTQEAVHWFKAQVAGKPTGAKLFTRSNAKGKERKGMDDPFAWGPHDQKKAMATACTDAKIDPIGFHELRHTYASGLVNAGVPLAFVAAQLGHIDTSMVEKHYGHLCPTAKAEAIRKLAPKLGIGQKKSKVEALKLKKA